MIGTLGELPFVCSNKKVLTFSDLTRAHETRWATHEVIGKTPVLEYVGEGLAKVSLSIRFDAALGILPKDGLDRLKRMRENKQFKTLIIGGEYLGRYMIENITEERKYHNGKGVCQIATATINLVEWTR